MPYHPKTCPLSTPPTPSPSFLCLTIPSSSPRFPESPRRRRRRRLSEGGGDRKVIGRLLFLLLLVGRASPPLHCLAVTFCFLPITKKSLSHSYEKFPKSFPSSNPVVAFSRSYIPILMIAGGKRQFWPNVKPLFADLFLFQCFIIERASLCVSQWPAKCNIFFLHLIRTYRSPNFPTKISRLLSCDMLDCLY